MKDKENALLLIELCRRYKTGDLADVHTPFFDTPAKWRCPCCLRGKAEIAGKNDNGALMVKIVFHHDHLDNYARDQISHFFKGNDGHHELEAFRTGIVRFAGTLICENCNTADKDAKAIVGADRWFSFAPFEIQTFIKVEANRPHRLDEQAVRVAYQAAEKSVELIRKRIAVVKAKLGGDEVVTQFRRVAPPQITRKDEA